MAIFFDEAKPLKLYNGSFYYPIDLKDRFHNSIVYLMTPNIQSSINVLNHPSAVMKVFLYPQSDGLAEFLPLIF